MALALIMTQNMARATSPALPAAAASITRVMGFPKVSVSSHQGAPRQVEAPADLFVSDRITVSVDQSVQIRLAEDSELVLGPGSAITIEELSMTEPHQTKLEFLYGTLRTWVKRAYKTGEQFVIQTPSAVMGVRGTIFITEVNRKTGETTLHTLEGVVGFGTPDTAPPTWITIETNETSSVSKGMAKPTAPSKFDPREFQSSLQRRQPLFGKLSGSPQAAKPKNESAKPQTPQPDTNAEKLEWPHGLKQPKKR